MRRKAFTLLACAVLSVGSLTFAASNDDWDFMLSDESSNQADQKNIGSDNENTQMPSDANTGSMDTGTADDDY